MKKLSTLFILLLAVTVTVKAQTQKGNFLIGAQLANIGGIFQSDNDVFNFGITPMVGFFIQDNLAVGPNVNFSYTHSSGDNYFRYGVGAFGRKYFEDPSIEFSKRSTWFLEANAGFQGENLAGSNTNGLGLGFGPGLAYFLTPNIGLEGLLKYNLTIGFGSSTTTNAVNLNVGFQIYLHKEKAKKIIEEEKKGQ
ncbi:outer membrane beta-barrel protein [Solitalea lacus]|uniref:outer membrane beta-barrel protein n=1 Tax=Solitalea lacus TaxID=2911172 RepID=UPI001EDA4161|nr:porin family protein [Solitalea lacus]UKJ07591.1 porin family protein [Solitalea lacus]